jgi:hypothetical protein
MKDMSKNQEHANKIEEFKFEMSLTNDIEDLAERSLRKQRIIAEFDAYKKARRKEQAEYLV